MRIQVVIAIRRSVVTAATVFKLIFKKDTIVAFYYLIVRKLAFNCKTVSLKCRMGLLNLQDYGARKFLLQQIVARTVVT